jgi:hypothetical protein
MLTDKERQEIDREIEHYPHKKSSRNIGDGYRMRIYRILPSTWK